MDFEHNREEGDGKLLKMGENYRSYLTKIREKNLEAY